MTRLFAPLILAWTLTVTGEAQDLCFAASMNDSGRQELWLHVDGRYTSINRDGTGVDWADRGTWRRVASNDYVLSSATNVRAVEAGRLRIGMGPRHLVSLLPDLADAIRRLLNERSTAEFREEEIRKIGVSGESCPGDHAYICAGGCNGPWFYHLNVEPGVTWPATPVKRVELKDLLTAIDAYLHDMSTGEFHITLVREAGYTIAAWRHTGVGWASQRTDIDELRQRLRSHGTSGFEIGSDLRLTSCNRLALLPNR